MIARSMCNGNDCGENLRSDASNIDAAHIVTEVLRSLEHGFAARYPEPFL